MKDLSYEENIEMINILNGLENKKESEQHHEKFIEANKTIKENIEIKSKFSQSGQTLLEKKAAQMKMIKEKYLARRPDFQPHIPTGFQMEVVARQG